LLKLGLDPLPVRPWPSSQRFSVAPSTSGIANERHLIALDLLAHGTTAIDPTQDVSFKAQAVMLVQFLDVLGIHKVEEKKTLRSDPIRMNLFG
jgi:hypothetical protein